MGRSELTQIAVSLLVALAIAAGAVAAVTAHFGPTSSAQLEVEEERIEARDDAREERAEAREEAAEAREEAAEGGGDSGGHGGGGNSGPG